MKQMKKKRLIRLVALLLAVVLVYTDGCDVWAAGHNAEWENAEFSSMLRNSKGSEEPNTDNQIDIEPIFHKQYYTLSFKNAEGAVKADGSVLEEESYLEGTEVELPTIEKKGYKFDGWYLDSDFTKKVEKVTMDSNIIVYAKFTGGTHKINYILYNGTNSESNPTTFDFSVGVPEFFPATRNTYTFVGWYLDRNFTKPVTAIEGGSDLANGDVTLYAKFSKNDESYMDEHSRGSLLFHAYQDMKYNFLNSMRFEWELDKGASYYKIYFKACDEDTLWYSTNKITATKTMKENQLVRGTLNSLSKDKYYAIIIRSFSSTGYVRRQSVVLHCCTVKNVRIGNCTSLTLNKSKVTIKKGKTFTIKAKEKNKNNRTIEQHVPIRFASSSAYRATVDKKGVITAKNVGTCTIYVVAQNGLRREVEITVTE